MAKVKAPLISLGAGGQIAKSVVFAKWRGVPYARQHVVPGNPRTTSQTLTRQCFQFADDQFKRTLTLGQSPWEASAKGKPFTARNRFISRYVKLLRSQPDFALFEASPGVNGGLPLLGITAVAGGASGEIDVTATIPPEPVDWTHDAVIITAFLDRAPDVQMTDFVTEAEVLAAAWAPGPPPVASETLTGLDAGADYCVSVFLRSTRADGVIAYGVSSTEIQASAV